MKPHRKPCIGHKLQHISPKVFNLILLLFCLLVTVDDSVKETSDCLDLRRDEVWEKSLPNKQVTFLVYREGDQLNFFRVVDRGDGTLTPVSESLRSVQSRQTAC